MDFLKQPATFRIKQLSGIEKEGKFNATWRAMAVRDNQVCVFKIQIIFNRQMFTMGKFIRADDFPFEPDGTWFLQELMSVLNVKDFSADTEPTNEIPFAASILGTNQYHHGSYFSSTKPGHWMPMKIFIGDDSSEVYLNLNSEEGIGEFSPKFDDGNDTIVNEFAKITLPKQGKRLKWKDSLWRYSILIRFRFWAGLTWLKRHQS